MQAEWEPDELIDGWTLTGGDWDLIANKALPAVRRRLRRDDPPGGSDP